MVEEAIPLEYGTFTGDVTPSAPCINEAFGPDNGYTQLPSAPALCFESQEIPRIKLPKMTEEDIREACYEYLTENCCYGSRFVQKMVVPEIVSRCVYHYRLESFGEKRETKKCETPYHGQSIDGPENGPAPLPWDIPVRAPQNFKDSCSKMQVPHTAVVKTCSECEGYRTVTCNSCNGRGDKTCSSCSGTGRNSEGSTCIRCNGDGIKGCRICDEEGEVTCTRCDGHGMVKKYTLLIVTWKNHTEDFVTDTLNLPKHLIRNVYGKEIFKEEDKKLLPICDAPDATVNIASTEMFQRHEKDFPLEVISRQRHTLRFVPLTKAMYLWKYRQGEFYVYGFENKVYFENYPQKSFFCTCL